MVSVRESWLQVAVGLTSCDGVEMHGRRGGGMNWEIGIDIYTLLVAQTVKRLSAMLETGVRSLGLIPGLGRSPGEGNGNPLQYSCLENPMDGGAWWAAVHGVTKSRTRLSDFTFTFHFHALEKEMATHSSVLAWRIPGSGEPGGLPSMGSHRIGHD